MDNDRGIGSPGRRPRKTLAAALLLVAAGPLLTARPWRRPTAPVRPSRIEFAPLRYYGPDLDPNLFEAAPFLDAVVRDLRSQGEAKGERFAVLVGTTASFDRPSPALRCVLDCRSKISKFQATGYTFRRHDGQALGVFEAIPTDREGDAEVFLVPACDRGDVLLFVLRLTQVEGEDIPHDPAQVVSLCVVE